MQIRDNVRLLYGFRFLRDFLLIMPAIVPLYLSCGLDATDILLIQALFSAATVAFEVPSGYLADVLGRRRALLIGAAAMVLGMLAYAVAGGVLSFAAAEITLAFGFSLFSGTESALMFESLAATGESARFQQLEGRAEAVTRIGTAVAAVLGGVLAGMWLRTPFVCNAVTAALMLAIASGMVEPPRGAATSSHTPAREMLRVAREMLADRQLRPALLLGAAVSATGVTAIWGFFLRLTAAGVSVWWYGIYFAVYQVSSALGAAGSDRVQRVLGTRGSYAVLLGIPAVYAACANAGPTWIVLLSPLQAALWGFSTPLLLGVLNRRVESARRATSLSASALLGRVLFVVLSPCFGALTDHVSGAAAFAMLTGVYLLLSGAAYVVRTPRAITPSR